MAMRTELLPTRPDGVCLRSSLIVTALILAIGLAPLAYGDIARRIQRRRLDATRRQRLYTPHKLTPAASNNKSIAYRAA